MSKKSDYWRDREAERVNDVLEQFKECVNPETLEANKDAWDNIANGNDASIDTSLNDPEPKTETETRQDPVDTPNDSNMTDDENPSDESTDDEDSE